MARPVSNADWIDAVWARDIDPAHVNRARGGVFASRALRDLMEALDSDTDPEKAESLVLNLANAAYGGEDLPGGVQSWIAPEVVFGPGSRGIGEARFASVGGLFMGPDGETVGDFRQTFEITEDGTFVVNYNELGIDPAHQGYGLGTSFNARAEDWYAKNGVKEIRLTANSETGGYAWAAAGYEWRDWDGDQGEAMGDVPDRLDSVIKEIESGTYRGLPPDEADAHLEDLKVMQRALAQGWVPPRRIAEFGNEDPWTETITLPDGGTREIQNWIGKDLLLGSNWYGVKKIDAENPLAERLAVSVTMSDYTKAEQKKIRTQLAEVGMTEEGIRKSFESLLAEAKAGFTTEEYEASKIWYAQMHKDITDGIGEDVDPQAAFWATAVLSPEKKWEQNLAATIYFANRLSSDEPIELGDEYRTRAEDTYMSNYGKTLVTPEIRKRWPAGREDEAIEERKRIKIALYVEKFGERYRFPEGARPSDLNPWVAGIALFNEHNQNAPPRGGWGTKSYRPYAQAVALLRGAHPDEYLTDIDGQPTKSPIMNQLKIRSFANNLTFPEEDTGLDLTVDVHVFNAAAGEFVDESWQKAMNDKPQVDYKQVGIKPIIADIIRDLARQEEMRPHEMQAIIWEWWRHTHPDGDKRKSERRKADNERRKKAAKRLTAQRRRRAEAEEK